MSLATMASRPELYTLVTTLLFASTAAAQVSSEQEPLIVAAAMARVAGELKSSDTVRISPFYGPRTNQDMDSWPAIPERALEALRGVRGAEVATRQVIEACQNAAGTCLRRNGRNAVAWLYRPVVTGRRAKVNVLLDVILPADERDRSRGRTKQMSGTFYEIELLEVNGSWQVERMRRVAGSWTIITPADFDLTRYGRARATEGRAVIHDQRLPMTVQFARSTTPVLAPGRGAGAMIVIVMVAATAMLVRTPQWSNAVFGAVCRQPSRLRRGDRHRTEGSSDA